MEKNLRKREQRIWVVVSYYYPPLEPSNLMEVVPEPNEEPENETVNYQQQLMETGMLGVPPMNWNL